MSHGKKPSTGQYTQAAMARKAAAKRAHVEHLNKAMELVAGGAGGYVAVASMVEGCSPRQIEYAWEKMSAKKQRPAWSILTRNEITSLVQWVLASARNDNPCTETQLSDKVTEVLQCRRLFNRNQQPQEWQSCGRVHPAHPARGAHCAQGRHAEPHLVLGLLRRQPSVPAEGGAQAGGEARRVAARGRRPAPLQRRVRPHRLPAGAKGARCPGVPVTRASASPYLALSTLVLTH